MQASWASNMKAVQTAIVQKGGFDWQNFRSVGRPNKEKCAEFLRAACIKGSEMQTAAVQFGMGFVPCVAPCNLSLPFVNIAWYRCCSFMAYTYTGGKRALPTVGISTGPASHVEG